MPVAPLRSLRGTWEAWVGYREVWNSLPGTEKFVFASSDITLFFTIAGTEDFQQILRAEWMGLTNNAGDWTFTPGNAAHPHWQIDITETLKSDTDLQTARELLRDSAPRVDSEAKCNPVDSIGSSTKSRVSHSERRPSARFPGDKDGSARRNIEPLRLPLEGTHIDIAEPREPDEWFLRVAFHFFR